MPNLYDLIFNGPLNLYKDYKLLQYIVYSGQHDQKRGRFYDSKPGDQGCVTSVSGHTAAHVALATLKSPFLLLYNAFTSANDLERMTQREQVQIEIAKRMTYRSKY